MERTDFGEHGIVGFEAFVYVDVWVVFNCCLQEFDEVEDEVEFVNECSNGCDFSFADGVIGLDLTFAFGGWLDSFELSYPAEIECLLTFGACDHSLVEDVGYNFGVTELQ